MILGEDDIANVIIFNTASIVKFISFYGYLHINRGGSVSHLKRNPDRSLINNLYILDALIVFTKESVKNKLILFKYIKFILLHKNLKRILCRSEYDNKVFISCLDRILNCNFISSENKTLIKKL